MITPGKIGGGFRHQNDTQTHGIRRKDVDATRPARKNVALAVYLHPVGHAGFVTL
jgi:hypothetical protein